MSCRTDHFNHRTIRRLHLVKPMLFRKFVDPRVGFHEIGLWTLSTVEIVLAGFISEAESDNAKRPLVDAKQQDLLLSLCTNPFVREQIYLGLPKRIWCLFPPLEQRETYFAAAMRRRDFVKALLENGSILRERTPDENLAITLSKLKFPLKIPVQKKISTTQTFFGVSRRRSRRF